MCEYIKENNICSINLDICPYMYFCNKRRKWIPLKSMPSNCKIKETIEVPKGYYKIRMERKGYLYVDIDNHTHKFLNPFDYTPLYVKVTKSKDGTLKIRK